MCLPKMIGGLASMGGNGLAAASGGLAGLGVRMLTRKKKSGAPAGYASQQHHDTVQQRNAAALGG